MPNEPANKAIVDEQLVAYLDGELGADASRQVEQRLAREPELRTRMQKMERAWGMLNSLDNPPLTAHFAQSTMEMVAVAARKDMEETQAAMPQLHSRRWGILAGSFLVAALAGVLIVGLMLPNPNKQLLRDLPVLVNLPHYCHEEKTDRYFEDYEFVERLQKEGLFVKEAGQTTTGNPPDNPPDATDKSIDRMTRSEKTKLVEGMDQKQKDSLKAKQKQFQELTEAERQKVRKLHEQLNSAPNGNELRQVMERYHRWLVNLPETRRTDLLKTAKTPQERIEKTKELLAQQAASPGTIAGGEPIFPTIMDWPGMARWARAYADRHRDHILRMHPDLPPQLASMTDTMRERVVAFLTFLYLQKLNRDGNLPPEALDELYGYLSKETQKKLRSKSPGEQHTILRDWLLAAHKRVAGGQFLKSVLVQVDDKELAQFEQMLTAGERDQLRFAPPNKKEERLRGLYVARMLKVIGEVGPRTGMGRGPGHRGPGPGPIRGPDHGPGPKPRGRFDRGPSGDFPPDTRPPRPLPPR